MAEILTITLNPTVDLSTSTPEVSAGPKLRCTTPLADPGGGGINVSRAIRFLGGHSTAFTAVGGETGALLLRLLAKEGVRFTAFSVTGDTRQSIAVTSEATGEQYRFVMPGPSWSDEMVDTSLTAIRQAAPEGGIVVLSGSQPPGVPLDYPARLSRLLEAAGVQLFLDTSGKPLHELARHPANPFVLRMDDVEAEDLAGRPLPTRADTADFASGLVAGGVARNVIVARGADGSTLATAEGRWHACRPIRPEEVVSAVGAGDSFVGAFCIALSRGDSLHDALCYGTAAASAAVLTAGTQLCTAEDVARLLPGCEVVPL
ncbi:1-phosphofructokinase family hexose kinase [Celeribacter indicus]|uniref:Phosphofructokinase n=1 Tax=Celeribacter indicus TaxID=1208324 RepID=A0A0B5DY00_9RHOB|nr:1-phosphofructokinase family hexose kinase [Celeribacter indicus]AJE48313.1 6-phosphofructokinase [Celeribacter indicus]SDW72523.1 6-phosphofructokinase [Celeribacter indicus]